ncbi:MAG: hypothetical protein HKN21_02645 [Candidatus Eisenbacteria bacterium]|uniref:Uncharacterized protein n=1 Tax=Eiseniibacteriota bacterium TaxID=2212470 RepID=A0A7Y2ECI1_UNCEI|nr:hypothetical protein [Candidatus Eisenbacteria bacterium]
MFRSILGVVLGYLTIAVWLGIALTLLWKALGPDFAFEPGTLNTTMGWALSVIPIDLMGAMMGGLVAALIDKRKIAVKVLAGFVLILGLMSAVMHIQMDDPTVAAEMLAEKPITEWSSFEAASGAIQPMWYNFVLPIVGMVGVLLGGRLKKTN